MVDVGLHEVQFYDDPRFLVDRVAGFFRGALHEDGAALAVICSAHAALLVTHLTDHGVDVAAARTSGRLVMIDTDEMLAKLMVDGLPDRARFYEHVAGAVARMPVKPHIYGEMVDVLWAAGHADAVIALEELWSELCAAQQLSLMCGYRLSEFGDDRHVRQFEAVCTRHDAVSPTERFALLGSNATTTRTLAALEQRALALETEVERRKRIERRMEQLLEIAGELARARTSEDIARLAIDKGIAAIGATTGGLWLLEPDRKQLRMLAVSDLPRGDTDRYRVLALDSDTPVAHAVRTAEPLFLESLAEYRAMFPASLTRIADTIPSDKVGYAMLPIVVDGAAIGCLGFSYDRCDGFDVADRTYLTILARQCALALERAQLDDKERAVRRDVEMLYELIAAVNRIDDIERVYELALAAVERGSCSDRSAILLFDPDGVMRFKASRKLSATYRAAVEGHTPWQPGEANPIAVVVDDTELDPAWAKYRDVFRAEGIRSLAFIPLVHARGLIGKFMLYRDEPRPFTARELQLTSTVAIHVAQAVERHRAEHELERAFTEERIAHLEAEESTRAREEILSVVSHDLRSPLNTIMLGASVMLGGDPTANGGRDHKIIERIHRQAQRMTRLIDDLVDFAGIQAGRLAIQPKLHEPSEILIAAGDLFGPLAQERGLRFETRVQAGLPPIKCDSDRAVQVMGNLLQNALKVTPRGGHIAIGAEPGAKDVVFFVRDTGPGIDPADLPNLFERFWRGKASSYKGAGLGLSIARGIIDAHGGKIWAESQLGTGSTFYFSF